MLSVSNKPKSNFSKWNSTRILSNHTVPEIPCDSDRGIPESKVGNKDWNPLKNGKTRVPYPVWDTCNLSILALVIFFLCPEINNYTFQQAARHPVQDIPKK